MPRSRYRIFETEYPYFMTCTIVGWLPVFTRPEAVEIIFDSWRYLRREHEFKLFGYVILENPIYTILTSRCTYFVGQISNLPGRLGNLPHKWNRCI